MIILTRAQADQVRGLTIVGYALAPRPLTDGTFALSEAVITDPKHAAYSTFLNGLTKRAVAANEYDLTAAVVDAYSFKTTWPAGVLQVIDAGTPTITSSAAINLNENVALSHALTANMAVTWTKTGGADAALFTLTGSTLSMAAKDFEAPIDAGANNTYIVQVTATSAGLATANQTITVTVVDAGDETAPTITSSAAINLAENSALAHTLAANEAVTWTKTGGADAAFFTVAGSTLSMTAKDFESPQDAGANNTYVVQVTATDAAGNATNQTITVTITDVGGEVAVTLPGFPTYVRVWQDTFASLSIRTGGGPPGVATGKGTWADAGLSYMTDATGGYGFGHDWFVRGSYNWQAVEPTFPKLGMVDIVAGGVQLKASEGYSAARALVPFAANGTTRRLLSALISSNYSAKIAVPFARRVTGTVSAGAFDFPAWWGLNELYAGVAGKPHLEIDDMERFGADYSPNHISQGIHWWVNPHVDRGGPVNTGSSKLNVQFETVIVAEATQVRAYLNGTLYQTMALPAGWDTTDLHHTILNMAVGLSWEAFPPTSIGSPVTTIRSVEIFAPTSNTSGIFPPDPPVPVLTWGGSFTGGVIPVNTASGTIVATLGGASSYTLLDYNGAAPSHLAVSGSNVVTSGTLSSGSFAFYIRGVDAAGVPGIAPKLTASIPSGGGAITAFEDLFSNGETGVLIKPWDLSTQTQLTSGTAVTTTGQPVGKITSPVNGHVLISDDSTARPTIDIAGGVYSLHFDGSNDYLEDANGQVPLDTFYAIFGVLGEAPLVSVDNRLFVAYPSGTGDDYQSLDGMLVGSDSGSVIAACAGSTTFQMRAVVDGTSIASRVIEIVKTPTVVEVYVDGVLGATDSAFPALTTLNGSGFGFASTYVFAVKTRGKWRGFLHGMAWTSRIVSAAERASCRTLMAAKQGRVL